MFARELQSTFGGARVGALLGSMSATFTAAGTTQATATSITTVYTLVTTATEGQGGILPSGLGASDQCTVANGSTVSIYVYPPVGGKINNGTANIPMMVAPNSAVDFTCVDNLNFIANR
jgi:hypothetical protein